VVLGTGGKKHLSNKSKTRPTMLYKQNVSAGEDPARRQEEVAGGVLREKSWSGERPRGEIHGGSIKTKWQWGGGKKEPRRGTSKRE